MSDSTPPAADQTQLNTQTHLEVVETPAVVNTPAASQPEHRPTSHDLRPVQQTPEKTRQESSFARYQRQYRSPSSPPPVPTPMKVKKKPGPPKVRPEAIKKDDKEAKMAIIKEIEKYWGKEFIKTYIPKVHRPMMKRKAGQTRANFRKHEDNPIKWLPSVLKAILSLSKKCQDKKRLKDLMAELVRYRNQHTGNKKPQLVTTDFDIIEDVIENGWTIPQSFKVRYKHLMYEGAPTPAVDPVKEAAYNQMYRGDHSDSEEEEDDEDEEMAGESDDDTNGEITKQYQLQSGYLDDHNAPPPRSEPGRPVRQQPQYPPTPHGRQAKGSAYGKHASQMYPPQPIAHNQYGYQYPMMPPYDPYAYGMYPPGRFQQGGHRGQQWHAPNRPPGPFFNSSPIRGPPAYDARGHPHTNARHNRNRSVDSSPEMPLARLRGHGQQNPNQPRGNGYGDPQYIPSSPPPTVKREAINDDDEPVVTQVRSNNSNGVMNGGHNTMPYLNRGHDNGGFGGYAGGASGYAGQMGNGHSSGLTTGMHGMMGNQAHGLHTPMDSIDEHNDNTLDNALDDNMDEPPHSMRSAFRAHGHGHGHGRPSATPFGNAGPIVNPNAGAGAGPNEAPRSQADMLQMQLKLADAEAQQMRLQIELLKAQNAAGQGQGQGQIGIKREPAGAGGAGGPGGSGGAASDPVDLD